MPDLEEWAKTLEASGDYRVLRRLKPREWSLGEARGEQDRLGIVMDCETTGLDPKIHEIIELAMVPFRYSRDGHILEVGIPFSALRQPTAPIPPEIAEITGLCDEDVAGHVIDPGEITQFVRDATVIIAHHAAFDRPFAERFHNGFAAKCWACSMSEIDWKAESSHSSGLAQLLADRGLFYDGHRALADCLAVIELLATPLPKSGVHGLARLLETARQVTRRIWAVGSPFELKDVLKARGYRWSDGTGNRPKSWYIDVRDPEFDTEVAFLRQSIYRNPNLDFRVERLTAYHRFSEGLS